MTRFCEYNIIHIMVLLLPRVELMMILDDGIFTIFEMHCVDFIFAKKHKIHECLSPGCIWW